MLEQEFINAVRHVASYYDMHLSPLSYNNFTILLPIVHSLVALMWINDYVDNEYSLIIKKCLQNFYKTGSFADENDSKN